MYLYGLESSNLFVLDLLIVTKKHNKINRRHFWSPFSCSLAIVNEDRKSYFYFHLIMNYML